jgi:hypothetical protein
MTGLSVDALTDDDLAILVARGPVLVADGDAASHTLETRQRHHALVQA